MATEAASAEFGATAAPASSSAESKCLRHANLRTYHGVLLRDTHMVIHRSIDLLKAELFSDKSFDDQPLGIIQESPVRQGWNCVKGLQSPGHQQHQQQPQVAIEDITQKRRRRSSRDETDSAASVCGATTPVLFPSELVTTIEVEHTDVFHPGELWLPLNQQAQWETRQQQNAESVIKSESSSTDLTQHQGGQVQQQQHPLPAEQKQQASQVHIRIDGKCDQIRVALSRSKCASLLR